MAPTSPLVVLIPPLLMPSAGMKPLEWRLQRGGRRTALFSYPSYRCTIPDNAARLHRFMEALGAAPLDVVTFSMGGVLLRWAASHHPLPPLRRVVMIGPPNRGASMATLGDQYLGPLFPLVFGRAARQLRTGDLGLCDQAGQLNPATEVGIIAGGTGKPTGFNPLIGRDNDRIVAVDETHLPGMADFRLLPIAHGPLVFAKAIADQCLNFLEEGRFA